MTLNEEEMPMTLKLVIREVPTKQNKTEIEYLGRVPH